MGLDRTRPVPLPFTFVDGKKETFCAVQTRVQVGLAKLQEFSKLKTVNGNSQEHVGINGNKLEFAVL